jgi:hypothetical protein
MKLCELYHVVEATLCAGRCSSIFLRLALSPILVIANKYDFFPPSFVVVGVGKAQAVGLVLTTTFFPFFFRPYPYHPFFRRCSVLASYS